MFFAQKKDAFLLLCCCCLWLIATAQYNRENTPFEQEFKTSFDTKPKLDFKFDSRFSFLRNRGIRTTGIKFGLSYNNRFKVGLGLNQALIPIRKRITNNDTIQINLEYFYFSPYFEYVFHNSKKWAFNLSTQVGLGEANHQFNNLDDQLIKRNQTFVLSYEPAMLIDYKLIRWVGIGTGIGYRLVLYKSAGIEERFSSPIFVIKLKVYLGEIVRSIRGKKAVYED